MKTTTETLLIGLGALLMCGSTIEANEQEIKDPSPDGKFAMQLTNEESGVTIQLVEVVSHKVLVDLANSGHPFSEDCKLLWAPDSQRVAFYEANRRGGDTTVYFRKDSEFAESSLPELDSCANAAQKKELQTKGINKTIESDIKPKRWLKSGALVVVNNQGWETSDGNLQGCTQTVTIAFDADHKASIQRVTGKRTKSY
jgi:hypothetical protein